MTDMWSNIISDMRTRMSAGCAISYLLRHVTDKWHSGDYDEVRAMKLLADAFKLSVTDVKAVLAWNPDGTGRISDGVLNEVVLPVIVQNRTQWTQEGGGWMAGLDFVDSDETTCGLSDEAWSVLPERDREYLQARINGFRRKGFALRVMSRLIDTLDAAD